MIPVMLLNYKNKPLELPSWSAQRKTEGFNKILSIQAKFTHKLREIVYHL